MVHHCSSGNNFAKLELLSRFMNMPFINKSNYFVSVVEKVWEDTRGTNIAKSKNEPVVVLGTLAKDWFLNFKFLLYLSSWFWSLSKVLGDPSILNM